MSCFKNHLYFHPCNAFGRGFRFLSSASASQRVEWDPTVSLALKHATLILLEKCSTRDHFKQILAQIMRTNLIGQTFPMSRLILFSAITHPENLDMAVLLFRHHTPHPNLYIYNTMISALSLSLNQSFAFYNSLLSSCIYPDRSTFLFLLQASKFLSQVMQIHCHAIITGSFSYGYLQNTLMKMYLENGKRGLAYQVFQQMAAPDAMVGLDLKPDEFTMLGLLICCGRLGDARLGKSVHAWIERRGLINSSNLILNNALLDMYVKCKELRIAQSIFNVIVRKDTVSWNTMIAGYAKVGNLEIAHNFFEDIRGLFDGTRLFENMAAENIWPDFVTIINLVSAAAEIELCTMVDGSMVGWSGYVTVWTTMITGFAFHGYGSKALELFYEMQEYVMPNQVTFVAVLTACIKDVIEMMPMKPSRSIWGAVLSACRAHGNIEIAEIAGKELLKLEPEKEGGYVLLSNIYATSGRWNHSDKIREIMESRGVKKTAGCSSVVVDGIIHEFVAADKRHPRWIEIQSILFCLKSEMKLGTDFLLEYLQPWCSC
ncbi:hypothetical protein AAG906_003427 [Vitis piasezkii]